MADIEPDAGEGGAGAPPAENAANRLRTGLTREYARPEIRVQWYASRCIHSAACIRALPAVFDPRRRPWVDVTAADADAIADAVVRCPTGALQYERYDGGPNETPPDTVEVTPVRDGPYLMRGAFEIMNPDGTKRREMRAALCRCGQSKHMPLCDNTHRAIGFRSQP
jgi:uncharacterized Fe-S cluster protein YjdI/CDGSH-type Zn-finger protein